MTDNTKDLTIEWQSDYRFYALYEFGVYERGSVLAGQTRKTFIRDYNTLEEAQSANPSAMVGYRDPQNTFNHLPDEEDSVGVINHTCYHDYSPCPCYPES